MSRCPYLEYESNNWISRSSDEYKCELCQLHFRFDDVKVEYTCKTDAHDRCPIYIKMAP